MSSKGYLVLALFYLENPRDGSLVGWRLWGRIELDTTDMT